MNITITLDKSTFQSLSYSELMRLSSYYKHNVAPVLVMEILGDLKKETQEGKTPSDIRVKDFARKLFPAQIVVNAFYLSLVQNELSGANIEMDGRPTLEVENIFQSDTVEQGLIIKETLEEKAIYKWKEGKFTEADHDLSQLWRKVTTEENLLKDLQKTLQSYEYNRLKTLDELLITVNNILMNHEIQDQLLVYIIANYGDGKINNILIFSRWLKEGRPLISEFVPYSAHCLKVDLLFQLGLQSGLIGTRPTNKVDLEYLYYLPFCNIFTSNDKIHKQLAPLLIRDDQHFIVGEDLKRDLMQILEHLEKEEPTTKKQFANQPPILEGSLTLKMWKDYFDYPNSNKNRQNISNEKMAGLRSTMEKIYKSSKGEKVEFKEGEAVEFNVRSSYITMNDPCFCGSGDKFKDCCIPKDEFIKISQKHKDK